ncbi:MAG: hypothetical protein ACOC5S_05110 [Acidobacteriota bacterium]
MILKKRDFIIFASLFIFFLVVLGINFFHTEKTVYESKDCPAGLFLNSALMTDQIGFYQPPELTFIELFKASQSILYHDFTYTDPSSRSPPSA